MNYIEAMLMHNKHTFTTTRTTDGYEIVFQA